MGSYAKFKMAACIFILIVISIWKCNAVAIDTLYISVDTCEWDSGAIKQYERKSTVQYLSSARSYAITVGCSGAEELYFHGCDSNCTIVSLSFAEGRGELKIIGNMWRGDSLLMTEWPGSFSSLLYDEYYVIIDHSKTVLRAAPINNVSRQPMHQGNRFDILGRIQRTARIGISIINRKPVILLYRK